MDHGLIIKNLDVRLLNTQGSPKIIDNLSLEIAPGEILGLVGESGSGKSMTALAIMGLLPPNIAATSGHIFFQGQDLLSLSPKQMRALRGAKLGMIFQEPMTALNPVFTIGRQVAEVYRAHLRISSKDAWRRAIAMLARVGLPDPEARAENYPHQLSGGLRQRVLIAMAMALNPPLLLADEPTTALDVTIQAQILSLLSRLTGQDGAACLLITHNLAVVSQLARRVAIMYAGRILELAPVRDLLAAPLHPYTQGLLASLPANSLPGRQLPTIGGTVPSINEIPKNACVFAPRCNRVFDRCRKEAPVLSEQGDQRLVACFLYEGKGSQL